MHSPNALCCGGADSGVIVREILNELPVSFDGEIPLGSSEIPDIEAKLTGEQKPRGWGLFLIEAMVDEVAIEQTDKGQAIVLTLNLDGGT